MRPFTRAHFQHSFLDNLSEIVLLFIKILPGAHSRRKFKLTPGSINHQTTTPNESYLYQTLCGQIAQYGP